MALFCWFLALQALDAFTTVLFLRGGIAEANPLIRFFLQAFSSPALALAIPKLAAVALAAGAWRGGRLRLLRRVNVFFLLCVAWNLAALATARPPAAG